MYMLKMCELRLCYVNYIIARRISIHILLTILSFTLRVFLPEFPRRHTMKDRLVSPVSLASQWSWIFSHRQRKLVLQRDAQDVRQRGAFFVRRSWGSRGRTQRKSIVEKIDIKNREEEKNTRDERNAATPCYCARKRNIIGERRVVSDEGNWKKGIARIGDRSCRYYLTRTCNDCALLHVRNRITEGIPSVGISSSLRERVNRDGQRQSWAGENGFDKIIWIVLSFRSSICCFMSRIAFPTLLNFISVRKNEKERRGGLGKLMIRSWSSWIWYLLNYTSLLACLTAQSYINFALQVVCNS